MRIQFMLFILGLAAAVAQAAQVEENFSHSRVAMPELKLQPGTRATSMGGALAAAGGLNAMYGNPSGLARVESVSLEFSHGSWLSDLSQETLAFGMPVPKLGAMAIGLQSLSLGSLEQTGEQGDGSFYRVPGDLLLGAWRLDLAMAGAVGAGWNAGADLYYYEQNLGARIFRTAAFNAGAQWQTDSGVRLGAGLENFGLGVESFSLPMSLRAGAAYAWEWPGEHCLEWAADLEQMLPLTLPLAVHIGGEYEFAHVLAVRLGYQLSDTLQLGGNSGWTAGLGVRWAAWTLGYSYVGYGMLGNANRISLTVDVQRWFQSMSNPRPLQPQPKAPAPEPALLPDLPARTIPLPALQPTVPSPAIPKELKPRTEANSLLSEETAMRALLKSNLQIKPMKSAETENAWVFEIQRRLGARAKSWILRLVRPNGKEVWETEGEGLPSSLAWDGRDDTGSVVEDWESLEARLTVTDVNLQEETAHGKLYAGEFSPDETGGEGFAPGASEQKFGPVVFAPNQTEIKGRAAAIIAQAAGFIRQNPHARVLVEGYCDEAEEKEQAMFLSKSRAEAVARYLVAYHKLSLDRILIKGRGIENQSVPLAGSPKERAANRRAMIIVQKNHL